MYRASAWCAVWLGLLGSRSADACSCNAPTPPVETAVARATLVFAGRVEEVRPYRSGRPSAVDGWERWGDSQVRVVVSRIWKGPDIDEIVVLTDQGTACGLDLYRGDEWLLYATGDASSGYTVHLCDRSTRAVEAEAARLGPPIHARVLPPLVPTPLERALAERDVAGVRDAIAGGADVNALIQNGWPMQLAVTRCELEIVRVLRAAGARGLHNPERALGCPNPIAMIRALDASREEWRSQLVQVARAGNVARVTVLLDAGVDPNLGYRNGFTPLAAALSGGHAGVAALLCTRGAVFDPEALAIALASPDPAIRARLLEADLTPDDAIAFGEPGADPGAVVAMDGCTGEVWRSGDRPGVRVAATGDGYRRVEELVVTDAECWENTDDRDPECDP